MRKRREDIERRADKFLNYQPQEPITLSCPISLAFNFKSYFTSCSWSSTRSGFPSLLFVQVVLPRIVRECWSFSSLRSKRFRVVSEQRTRNERQTPCNRKSRSSSMVPRNLVLISKAGEKCSGDEVAFHGLSLLRNHKETLATQAIFSATFTWSF